MTTVSDLQPHASRQGRPFELAVVFGLTVGVPLGLEALSGHFVNFDFGERRLLRTIAAEVVAVALLWPWLARRGWKFGEIAGRPRPVDVWRGFGVAVLAYLVYWLSAIAWIVFVPGMRGLLQAVRPSGAAAMWVVLLVALVNPMVEEFLWLGYGFTALERYGTRVAVAGTIALRVSLHLYQGWMALVGILPVAVVLTVYFAEKRRIWPVIVAHMIVDTVGLLALQKLR